MQTLSEKLNVAQASRDGTNCQFEWLVEQASRSKCPAVNSVSQKGLQTGNAKTDINTKKKESGIIRFLFVTVTDF